MGTDMALDNDGTHRLWLADEATRLLDFAEASQHPLGGFGMLRADGTLDMSADVELWVTCRMTYCFSLAAILGRANATALVDHGLEALAGRFRDEAHAGWYAAVGADGPTNDRKEAYGHAFVILAASAASIANRPGARTLLDEALEIHATWFWDARTEMSRESYARDWCRADDYRGVNANMHTVEAYLAAYDATGDKDLLTRATRIAERVVHGFAPEHGWRLPEHFDAEWRPLLDYNADAPADPFRPFGATVGHWFEWSRLTVQLAWSLERAGLAPQEWMVRDAREFYDAAVREGWNVDGAPGFVYTVDWNGHPVVRERMHWVVAEAIAAAAAMEQATGLAEYRADYDRWWAFAREHHIDQDHGSWWHELSPDLSVGGRVWPGKVDTYHALQATLLPRVPVAPGLAQALASGLHR